jgi:hypothetical protein
MDQKQRKESLLTTWKEISSYLCCNEKTAQRWEIKYGLPVRRPPGLGKSRVHAYKEELDEWLRGHPYEKSLNKSQKNAKIKWQKAITYIFVPIILVIMIFLFFIKNQKTNSPADFRIDGSSLIILDKKGRELWRFDTELKNLIDEKNYRIHFQIKQLDEINGSYRFPYLIIKDINSDDQKEVIFNAITNDQFRSRKLYCFSNQGEELWSFRAGREIKFGSTTFSPDFWIKGFLAEDLDGDGQDEIFIICNNRYYAPTQFVVLDSVGDSIGTYWNFGRLVDVNFTDINNDSQREILLCGTNNEFESPCVIVFGLNSIKGGSPGKSTNSWQDIEKGTEKYYLIFPRTDADRFYFANDGFKTIDNLSNNRLAVCTINSNISYELDYKLMLLDIRISHSFKELYNSAINEGIISTDIDDQIKKLAENILYFNGEKWTAAPAMSNSW